jgi:hypothetical protein
MMNRLQTLLSNSTCAATSWFNEPGDNQGHGLWDPLDMLKAALYYGQWRGRALQVDSIKMFVESTYGFSA